MITNKATLMIKVIIIIITIIKARIVNEDNFMLKRMILRSCTSCAFIFGPSSTRSSRSGSVVAVAASVAGIDDDKVCGRLL